MNVTEAVATRRSIRAFLDKPVDRDRLKRILVQAQRAASGGNLQPWHIHLVIGDRLAALKAVMADRVRDAPDGEGAEYAIYPPDLRAPYRDRVSDVGRALYASLGIGRDERAARRRWFSRNFQCFGAPAVLFCYVDRSHGPPQWADCGIYLQTVMLLLREAGLDSCAQECWALYPRTLDAFLAAPETQMLFAGLSIGWRDPAHPANEMESRRAPLQEFLTIHVN